MKTTMTPPNLKSCLALAVMGLACAGATAQSNVTIYGIVEVGLIAGNNTTTTAVQGFGIAPSIWGFKGTEDLGGGLKASFNLESHFSPDTGAQLRNTFFGRQANVGLSSSSMGTLTLGNMYTPAALAYLATEPRGLRENFSGLYTWAYNSGALVTPVNGNNDVGVFMQNAIAYSNTLGPVGVSVGYSVSELKGAVTALGLTYTGPIVVSASYQTTNHPGTSSKLSTMYTVGAGYTMGDMTIKANYLNGVNTTVAGVDTNEAGIFGIGLDWKTSSANTVLIAYYHGNDDKVNDSTTNTFVVANEYALSKRTTLYGQLAFANADSAAGLRTSVVAGGTQAGKTTSLLNVGIKHSF